MQNRGDIRRDEAAAPIQVRPRQMVAGGNTVHLSGPNVPDYLCQLVGLDAGTLRVRSERRIADASPMTVSFDHIQLAGVVTGCHAMGNDWGVSIALTVTRRREARLAASGRVTVGIVGDAGTTSWPATVTNVSPSGLGLRVPEPVRLASRIYVETETEMIMGEVRHCRPAGDGQFIVGVLIVEVVPDLRTQGRLATFWERVKWRFASRMHGGYAARGPEPK